MAFGGGAGLHRTLGETALRRAGATESRERLTAIDPTELYPANQAVIDFGVVTSTAQTFNISITAVNDAASANHRTTAEVASPSPGREKSPFQLFSVALVREAVEHLHQVTTVTHVCKGTY